MAKKTAVEKEKPAAAEKAPAVSLDTPKPEQSEADYSNHPKMAKFKTQGSQHT